MKCLQASLFGNERFEVRQMERTGRFRQYANRTTNEMPSGSIYIDKYFTILLYARDN